MSNLLIAASESFLFAERSAHDLYILLEMNTRLGP